MFDNVIISEELFALCVIVLPIISILCLGAFIGDQVFYYQERAAKRFSYGNAKVGHVLKPNDKKCKFTTTMRNILAKLRFN